MRTALVMIALVLPASSFAYPGGTPGFQTDVAPYCSGCHSSLSEAVLAGSGPMATKMLAENNHFALIEKGEGGYEKLGPAQRAELVEQLRALDAASSVVIEAPTSVAAGTTFQVTVRVTGGAGPVVGVGLVDAAHRWRARPVTAGGFTVVGPPKITGSDGAEQRQWLDKRPHVEGRNLSFVNVTGIASDASVKQWASAQVVWTLRAPAVTGTHPVAASYWYGTEKGTPLGYVEDPVRGKQIRGGFTGHSGRVVFSDVLQVEVK